MTPNPCQGSPAGTADLLLRRLWDTAVHVLLIQQCWASLSPHKREHVPRFPRTWDARVKLLPEQLSHFFFSVRKKSLGIRGFVSSAPFPGKAR